MRRGYNHKRRPGQAKREPGPNPQVSVMNDAGATASRTMKAWVPIFAGTIVENSAIARRLDRLRRDIGGGEDFAPGALVFHRARHRGCAG